ncbi:hypothetical protein CALVIDRAFT_136494 [Calocera viscosa TUFC12733]|uniref:Uncharacterized protein n=1 Tax=Calocera viscosa (strain TUFC12733) TaxID=1330018 RepID=A0A167LYS8_CALVF|nr:hypothetical protein CALVIDRAFT_136494 [Calocera viscosa TUFC12733]
MSSPASPIPDSTSKAPSQANAVLIGVCTFACHLYAITPTLFRLGIVALLLIVGALWRFHVRRARAQVHPEAAADTCETPAVTADTRGWHWLRAHDWNILDAQVPSQHQVSRAPTELEWRPVGPNRVAARLVPVVHHLGQPTHRVSGQGETGREQRDRASILEQASTVRNGVIRAQEEHEQPPRYLDAGKDTRLAVEMARVSGSTASNSGGALPPAYEVVEPGGQVQESADDEQLGNGRSDNGAEAENPS